MVAHASFSSAFTLTLFSIRQKDIPPVGVLGNLPQNIFTHEIKSACPYGKDFKSLLFRISSGIGVRILLIIIQMRRRIGNHKGKPYSLIAPVDIPDGLFEGGLQVLGSVTAAVGSDRVQLLPELIKIIGQGSGFRYILVASVPVQHHPETHVRSGCQRGEVEVDELYGLSEPCYFLSHASGGIEYEEYVQGNGRRHAPWQLEFYLDVPVALPVDSNFLFLLQRGHHSFETVNALGIFRGKEEERAVRVGPSRRKRLAIGGNRHVGVRDRLSVPVLYVQDDSFVDVDGVMLNKGFIFPQKADKIIELLVVVGVARAQA